MPSKRGREDEDENEYEVKELLERRGGARRTEYLVKGYVECTWVKKTDLQCDDLVAAFESRNTAKAAPRQARMHHTEEQRHDHRDSDISDNNEATEFHYDNEEMELHQEADQTELREADEETNTFAESPHDLPAKRRRHVYEDEETKGSAGSDDGDDGDGNSSDGSDSELDDFAVEAILNKRVINGVVKYQVKWATSEKPTWEPIDNLDCGDLISAYESQKSKPCSKPRVRAPRSSTPRPKEPSGRASASKTGLERSYLGKLVAYSPATTQWLKKPVYAVAGSTYIVGRVCDYKYANKRGMYEIRWIDSMFQKDPEKVDLAAVIKGRDNYDKLVVRNMPRWKQLCRPNPDNAVEMDDDMDDLVEYDVGLRDDVAPTSLKEVKKIQSMRFEPGKVMLAPGGLYSNPDGTTTTHVKVEYKETFEHSASSSFFAYLPVYFWKQVLQHTNEHARDLKITATPFTMGELMKFLGIIWFMAVVDKGEYKNYWGEQMEDTIFGTTASSLDSVMPLRRFKNLRQAFCFRKASDITPGDLKRDAAVRIRTVLNMLKQMGSRYIVVGRNLAVDEASVAARSKFARHIIVYNPRKPTGKYHFKLYMCCCATSWIALSFRLHCQSTLQDRTAGIYSELSTEDLEAEMASTAKTRQIVLEITRPFHGSDRIVNCDNYYTSVQLLEALRLKGLYCRGTVKQASKHFPRHVVLAEPDKAHKHANKSKNKRNTGGDENNDEHDEDERFGVEEGVAAADGVARVHGEVKRGDFLQASSADRKMLAASWCDGNIVTMISNADPSAISLVERLIKGKKREVSAPTAIKEYNQNMQGVDRNDQVRGRFSVADGHSFKKWHKKLGFAIVDIARVNAYLTRSLSMNDTSSERDAHRQFMVNLIKEMLNGKWQDAPCDDVMLFDEAPDTPSGTRFSTGRVPFSPTPISPTARAFAGPTTPTTTCTGVTSSQVFKGQRRKRACIVCRFEGRSESIITVVCLEDNVCVCKSVHDSAPYGCQRSDWTCWEKLHIYYLPEEVFAKTGCVNRSSSVYKEKKVYDEEQLRTRHAQENGVQSATASRSLSFDERVTPSPSMAATPSSVVSATLSHDFF